MRPLVLEALTKARFIRDRSVKTGLLTEPLGLAFSDDTWLHECDWPGWTPSAENWSVISPFLEPTKQNQRPERKGVARHVQRTVTRQAIRTYRVSYCCVSSYVVTNWRIQGAQAIVI